jgi:hypothetical protein
LASEIFILFKLLRRFSVRQALAFVKTRSACFCKKTSERCGLAAVFAVQVVSEAFQERPRGSLEIFRNVEWGQSRFQAGMSPLAASMSKTYW